MDYLGWIGDQLSAEQYVAIEVQDRDATRIEQPEVFAWEVQLVRSPSWQVADVLAGRNIEPTARSMPNRV